ncbi:Membrane-bound lytic murein transglycosylase F [termite gut metagenome]|uniref:Membrane-bound lytic murein transglycosylase F n=1 Tax=termite gut metagenome TaxID=433724 RepID=A0A5J4RWA9_9ZZZZ
MKRLNLLFFLLLSFVACKHSQSGVTDKSYYDLPQIKDSGELVILTVNDAMASYFIYRDEEMGYQYEISQLFAKSLGVKAQVKTVKNVWELSQKLLNGEGDIILYNFPIVKELRDSMIYCGEENITHQVIVQQNIRPLKDVTELIGQEVYVTSGKYYDRLVNLNNELGGGIQIKCVEGDSITTEILISKVSKGEIKYTVCDNRVARLNATYFPNINTKLSISFDQRSSWAVRRNTPLLAQAANEWYEKSRISPEYMAITKRYFEMNKTVHYSPILSAEEGKISHFDHLFKQYAKEIGWDWRFLAAIAFTESNFNPKVVSWAGARGLMQLMPGTARFVGVPAGKENNPEENIKGAVKYLSVLETKFRKINNKQERMYFVLAAYNAGHGHIFDAMALTEKYGRDKYKWFGNVEHYLLLKSNEGYYTDPVCKNGYLRGIETYNFVRKIHTQYDRYKKMIKKEEDS